LSGQAWQVRPEPQRSRHEATLESVGGSASQTSFGEERKIVLGLLGLDVTDARPIIRGNGDGIALCDIFARLLKLSEIDVLTVLTYVMAESLEVGNASVEALGDILPVSLGREAKPDWRPRWAAFPFSAYRSGDGIRPAAAWKKVSRFFQKPRRSA